MELYSDKSTVQDDWEVLRQIKKDIPRFAVWKVDELYTLFNKYKRVMLHVIKQEEYESAAYLSQHAPYIEHYIMDAMKAKNINGKKDAFEIAVTNLAIDINYLLTVIGIMEQEPAS